MHANDLRVILFKSQHTSNRAVNRAASSFARFALVATSFLAFIVGAAELADTLWKRGPDGAISAPVPLATEGQGAGAVACLVGGRPKPHRSIICDRPEPLV